MVKLRSAMSPKLQFSPICIYYWSATLPLYMGDSSLRSPMSFHPSGQFPTITMFLFWVVVHPPFSFQKIFFVFLQKNWRKFSEQISGENMKTLMWKNIKKKLLWKIEKNSKKKTFASNIENFRKKCSVKLLQQKIYKKTFWNVL